MLVALVVLLLLAAVLGYYGFRERGPIHIEHAAKAGFFVVWSLFTVILTLFIFKNMLKPTVEVKFNTKSWNEITGKDAS